MKIVTNLFKRIFDKKIAKIETNDAITVKVPGRPPFTINRENELFEPLKEAVEKKDEEKALGIIAIAEKVSVHSGGDVEVKNGQVFYKGEVVGNIVAKRIVEFAARGLDVQYLINFLDRVMQNPLPSAREELYLFLKNGNLPIMDDGRFMAYKWVRGDYMDCHSQKFRNRPGDILRMKREDVDTSRDNTCSYGFHVCTQFYSRFGERLMKVAIDPVHVVAVPKDYNNAKMRVCEYEVLHEIENQDYGSMKEEALAQYQPAKELADKQAEELAAQDRAKAEEEAAKAAPPEVQEVPADYDDSDSVNQDLDEEPIDDDEEEGDVGNLADVEQAKDRVDRKGDFEVILVKVSLDIVNTIKIIRQFTGCGLMEAKDLVDAALPVPIITGISRTKARSLQGALKNYGTTSKVIDLRGEPAKVKKKPKKEKLSDVLKTPNVDWNKFKKDVVGKRSNKIMMKRYNLTETKLKELKEKARKELKK